MAKLLATYTANYSLYSDGTASLTATNKTDGSLLMLSSCSTSAEVLELLASTLGLCFEPVPHAGTGAFRLVPTRSTA
jgi:hypothetical protein